MILQVLITAGILIVMAFLVLFIRLRMHLPVSTGTDTKLLHFVTARGDAPELEHTLRDLIWLRENGMLPGEIRVVDCGLSSDASELVQRLSRDYLFLDYYREGESSPWKIPES